MSNQINMFFEFLDYCETNINSKNDMRICKVILENASHLESVDIKSLAKMSGTSTASVSRFVNRFPAKSYKDFIHEFAISFHKFEHAKLEHRRQLQQFGEAGILDEEKKLAYNNLQGTAHVLNYKHMDRLCDRLLNAKSVTFLGANHSLEIVSELHLLLNGLGIPSFIYKQVDRVESHLSLLGKEDLVVFISIEGRYQSTIGNKLLEKLNKNNIPTALITQTKKIDPSLFNEVLYFGIDQSWNYGYYSLPIVVKAIARVLINKA